MAENNEKLALQDVKELICHFAKSTYRATNEDALTEMALDRCKKLAALDYNYTVIPNTRGEFSAHYPSQILVFNYEKNVHYENTYASMEKSADQSDKSVTSERLQRVTDLIKQAKKARCRSRFLIPAILYEGKQICRSATISGGAEIYSRSYIEVVCNNWSSGMSIFKDNSEDTHDCDYESENAPANIEKSSDWPEIGRVRKADIKLLNYFKVDTIIDFMVERKKVKYGMYVTSSEKADKENRYANFKIISLPYPGCEFFRLFRENNYEAHKLFFDWKQDFVDANLGVPDEVNALNLNIDWKIYKDWDLLEITKNYMKLILHYLQEKTTGLLLHCISGWDRTPLFISLVRLSLWADGLVHPSLDPMQILYFTVAYDWFLFGHNLHDRLEKGEEIFYFCFYFLKYLGEQEFSIKRGLYTSSSPDSHKGSENRLFNPFSGESFTEANNGNKEEIDSFFTIDIEESTSPVPPFSNSSPENRNSPPSPTPAISSPPKRTSPVAVPINRRKRNESTGSQSSGSWQMISTTGSLHDSASDCERPKIFIGTNAPVSNESNTTLTDEDCFIFNQILPDSVIMRKEKLDEVRYLFLQSYCPSIGMKFNTGDYDLGLLGVIGEGLGNIVGKLGNIITSNMPST